MEFTLWRDSHRPSLSYLIGMITKKLSSLEVKKADYSITQRIKRFYSIILKLKRFPDMQLSMMDDIAGTRVVLKNNKDTFDLFDRLKEKRTKNKVYNT